MHKGTLETATTASFPVLEIVKSNFQMPGIRDRLVTPERVSGLGIGQFSGRPADLG